METNVLKVTWILADMPAEESARRLKAASS